MPPSSICSRTIGDISAPPLSVNQMMRPPARRAMRTVSGSPAAGIVWPPRRPPPRPRRAPLGHDADRRAARPPRHAPRQRIVGIENRMAAAADGLDDDLLDV